MSPVMKVVWCLLISALSLTVFAQTETNTLSKSEQTAQFQLKKAEKYINNNLDSAFYFGKKAAQNLPKLSKVELKAEILFMLGDIYKAKGQLVIASNKYYQAKKLIDNAVLESPKNQDLKLLKADILLKIGSLNIQLQNFDKSLGFYEESLKIIEKLGSKLPKAKLAKRKLKLYNNIAVVSLNQKDFETALVYFQNALESNQIVNDLGIQGSLLNNIGICYLEKKEFDLASHYFQQSLKIRKANSDKQGQAQVLNNIGKNEVFKGNFQLASDYFSKALALSREIGSKESALISLQSLSLVQDTMGNYQASLKYFRDYKTLNDSIFNAENRIAIVQLEENYKRENEKKIYELKLQKNEAERLKLRFRNFTLLGILALLLLSALLFIIVMRSRIKNAKLEEEKLKLESEKLALEHRTLQESLEFKERELTANALYLLKNNELITKISDNLLKAMSSFDKENQQAIREIISELRANQNNNVWDEFEMHFTKVHAQFYPALQERFPNLTSNEKKLCAFLRLNMSTKDISAITQQSVNSITVARSRLRKKLNIEGEDVHLVNFLMSI
jgi:tetratricopeptide (TPR) repeat protein